MELLQVYEKYKHLDKLFCDPLITDRENLPELAQYEMWLAIKTACERPSQDVNWPEKIITISGGIDSSYWNGYNEGIDACKKAWDEKGNK